jgi:hypothetical protein
LILEFGLGSAVSVDSVVVEWPSGLVERWGGAEIPSVNQVVRVEENVGLGVVGIEGWAGLAPGGIRLTQNYPNPFRPSTRIGYSLPHSAQITLGIYTVQGREVVRLVDGRRPAGQHGVVWNGTDARGDRVSSGVYYYRLVAKDETSGSMLTSSKRLVLLR